MIPGWHFWISSRDFKRSRDPGQWHFVFFSQFVSSVGCFPGCVSGMAGCGQGWLKSFWVSQQLFARSKPKKIEHRFTNLFYSDFVCSKVLHLFGLLSVSDLDMCLKVVEVNQTWQTGSPFAQTGDCILGGLNTPWICWWDFLFSAHLWSLCKLIYGVILLLYPV